MTNKITYTYNNAVQLSEHYARVAMRLHARLLVREDCYDGRAKAERELRKAIETVAERAEHKSRILARIAMLLQMSAQSKKLVVPSVPLSVPHGTGVFRRVAC